MHVELDSAQSCLDVARPPPHIARLVHLPEHVDGEMAYVI